MAAPRVSVIIITLNEEENLPHLLRSLAAQTYTDFETLVVDSRSTDTTEKVARRYGKRLKGFHFHRMKGRGIALGRNTGAELARGDILFFMDADITVPAQFLAKSVTTLEQKRLDVGGVFVRARSSHLVDRLCFGVWNILCFLTQWFYPHTIGSCIVCRKEVHKAIGGFDPTIALGEDSEFSLRASRRFRVRMLPVAIDASARRFSTDGRFRMVSIYVRAFFSRVLFGEIKSDRFRYWFGHHSGNEEGCLSDGRPAGRARSNSAPSRRRR